MSDSRRALFIEWTSLIDHDPSSEAAQSLLARWEQLLDVETEGDEGIKADIAELVRRRHSWPAGMRRYMASLYGADLDTWSRVSGFIEQALAYKTSGESPSRRHE